MQKPFVIFFALYLTSCGGAKKSSTENIVVVNASPENFQIAIKGGDEKSITRMLDAMPSLVNFQDADGNTPVHVAAAIGSVNMLKLLLAKGGDCNAENKKGIRPLHKAVQNKQKEAYDYLIANGAIIKLPGAPTWGLVEADASRKELQEDYDKVKADIKRDLEEVRRKNP